MNDSRIKIDAATSEKIRELEENSGKNHKDIITEALTAYATDLNIAGLPGGDIAELSKLLDCISKQKQYLYTLIMAKNDQIDNTIAGFMPEKEALLSQIEVLKKENETLKKENADLSATSAESTKKLEDLQNHIEKLSQDNKILQESQQKISNLEKLIEQLLPAEAKDKKTPYARLKSKEEL